MCTEWKTGKKICVCMLILTHVFCLMLFELIPFSEKWKNYLAIAQENVTEYLFPSKMNRCTLAATILYLY